jgi:diguanylate cyclase
MLKTVGQWVDGTTVKSRAWLRYLSGVAVVALAYLVAPSTAATKLVLYNGIGLSAVVAVLVGVRRNRPTHRRPWLLFAAGQLSFLTADVVYYLLEATGTDTPFPSPADAFYLGMYPLVIAGLLLMVRRASPGRDWASLIDATLIATAMFVVLGILLMDDQMTDPTLSPGGRLISLAYPVMDVALLAVAVRLAVVVQLRHPASALMGASLVSLLVADTAYGVLSSAGTFETGGTVDLFWIGFYALFAAAALHPSMADHGRAATPVKGHVTMARLVVLCLATLTVPVIDLLWGQPVDKLLTTTASAAMFLLVLGRVLGLMRNVQASEERLRHDALHDGLTGLANRKLFSEQVEHCLAGGGCDAVAVLFVDLDDFKTVNDSLGHHAGDELLRVVANRLRRCLGPADTVARLGGDEFAALLPSVADPHEATSTAARLLDSLTQPVLLNGREVRITASVGIAMERGDGQERLDALLRGADVAMYLAKSKGKGRAELFEESMYREAMERLELRHDLEVALGQGQFRIHYQPIIDLDAQRIVSVEALLRWAHPTRGLVGPDRFIPLAEQSGLIVGIGRWVLQEACAQVRSWQLERPDEAPLGLSVNLSVRQLQDNGLLEDVAEALRLSGLDPHCLTLEITESMLIEETDRGAGALARLKTLGVRLAIDDFGTGYSSLSYLRRFPADTLKIDRSFVREMHESVTSEALVRTVIDLARDLKMATIAEGIEDHEQWSRLSSLNCDLGQGYYFSQPIEADAMMGLLRRESGGLIDLDRRGSRPVHPSPGRSGLVVELREGRDALAEVAAELDDLHDATDAPLMARRRWTQTWASVNRDKELLVIGVRNQRGGLDAAAVLARATHADHLELVGAGHGSWACTRLPARTPGGARLLADAIARQVRGSHLPVHFELDQLAGGDPVVQLLLRRLPEAELHPTAWIPQVALRREEPIEAHLSRNLRRQLRKATNRAATDGRTLAIHFERDHGEIAALLPRMEEIHMRRDHTTRAESDLDDPGTRRFWQAIILACARDGRVEVGTLHIDGDLAAYVVAILDGDAYRIFDGHCDTTHARYSPGRLIETAALQRAAGSVRYRVFDWMSGEGAEKILAANLSEARMRLVVPADGASVAPIGGRVLAQAG